MSNPVSRTLGFDRREPIPGYKTLDLLGRGGYGEVWRATAPGGIAKAIKIVFGDADASHASTEMRALSRIKDVRHPLLLSIERIEVTQGNLVIVTELADYSLKQHFQSHQQAKKPGLPQDEILGYIADAAEALDFLYEKHSLQHLDVKPENILIVGGRAKVGDFGLVKNLYERSASLVGGLTPTYAPPELFEGRPTRHSDQYSLAIVYVHMLTGLLPFTASNMAQLATLHLRGVPDLSPLPKSQRPVIARALSKDPSQRFDSCTAMVQALRDSLKEPEAALRRAGDAAPAGEASSPMRTAPLPLQESRRSGDTQALPRPAAAIRRANLADAAGETVSSHTGGATESVGAPTILVGLGGAGVEVLAKLVRRLNDRFGGAANWPAVEILAFDANTRTLTSQFQEDDLDRVRLVPIPLKSADSYGGNSGDFVRWLGRRWFYNIPRDLTSAGYRPLGRLALVSHAPRVRDAIGAAVVRAAESAALSGSKGDAGRPAPVSPRVIVVGSIAGGTGGGALFDVAYAVRSELKRRGLSDERVHGLLLYATPRSSADRDRARANAYSTLSELSHFSAPGSHFPGEPLLGASPFHGDNATFSRTHLLHLGEGLGQAEWDLATDQIAEFLYGATFTPAQRLLDDAPEGDAGGSLSVQPHEVLALGAGIGPIVSQTVRQACNDVIRLWREGRRAQSETAPANDRTVMMNTFAPSARTRSKHVDEAVRQQLAQHRLDLDRFTADATEVLKLEVGADVPGFVSKLVEDSLHATRSDFEGAARIEEIFALVDRVLQCESEENLEDPICLPLYAQLVSRLGSQSRGRAEPFLSWLRGLVDAPEVRIEGARQNATEAQRILQTLQDQVLAQAAELADSAQKLALETRGGENLKPEGRFNWSLRRKDPDDRLREVLTSYVQTRVKEVLRRAVAKIVRVIDAELSTLIEQLDRLSRELSLLAEPVRAPQTPRSPGDEESDEPSASPLAGYRQLMLTQLGLRRPELARRIEEAVERAAFADGDGLRRFLRPESELRKSLWKPLADASRHAVLECVREISCQMIASGSTQQQAAGGDLFALLAEGAEKSDTRHGDAVCRLLIVPEEVDPSLLRERLRTALPDAVIARGRKCDVTLCTTRPPASLARVADDLISGVPLYRDLADRLHSRIDISWRPFAEPREAAPEPAFASAGEGSVTRTAALPV